MYAELHCISNYSFLRGASHPEELVKQAAHLGYSAIAITDECTMAGIVKAHVAAKECDIKLIVGSEFRLD
jgi:error-prone DNA polymerase